MNDRDEMVDVKMYRELVFPLGLENMKISIRIMVAEFPFLGGHAASLRLPYLSLNLPLSLSLSLSLPVLLSVPSFVIYKVWSLSCLEAFAPLHIHK